MPVSQSGGGRPYQSASACAPEGRNHNSLDKNLSDNPPAARPNRHADGNLARSVCRPRGEQAAEVSADGEQHNPSQPQYPSQKTACRCAEKVNAGIHDYIRAISDRPKRAAECDEPSSLRRRSGKKSGGNVLCRMLRN